MIITANSPGKTKGVELFHAKISALLDYGRFVRILTLQSFFISSTSTHTVLVCIKGRCSDLELVLFAGEVLDNYK